MGHNDHIATRNFFREEVRPFMASQNMGIKELAKGLGIDPKNVAKFENGILIMRSKDKQRMRKFMDSVLNPVKEKERTMVEAVPTPVPTAPTPLPTPQEPMPEVPATLVRDLLAKYCREHKLTHKDLGELVELSQPSISRFLRGDGGLNRTSMEKVTDYLKNEKVLTRLGLPTAAYSHFMEEAPKEPERRMPTEAEILREIMGTNHTQPADVPTNDEPATRHHTNDVETMVVIASIMMYPHLSQGDRTKIIRKLYPKLFPNAE